jgi:uncharacterized protein (DUF1499 family)
MLLVACVLAVLSVVMLLVGPIGARLGMWPFFVGFALMGGAILDALAAIIVAVMAGMRTHRWGVALAAIGVAAVAMALPLFIVLPAIRFPPIHDITTDPDDPPAFDDALLKLRKTTDSPPAYDGPDAAAQQRRAYPDIQPVVLNAPASRVFDAALDVAREQGWQVVATDRAAGRIDAIASTFWFGFKDDVVIRLRPQEAVTRIDMRSKSRVGVGDLGANARRIRLFVSALRDRLPS